MKPIAVVLVVLLAAFTAAAATAVGLSYLHFDGGPTESTYAEPIPAGPAAVVDATQFESLGAQLTMIGDRLATLEREVGDLRAAAAREPALADIEPAVTEPLAAAELEYTEEQREVIAQIMDEVRAEEQKERDEQRRQREEDQILERADRIARELGLSVGDQKALADHMTLAMVKRGEIMDRAREEGFDRETMRSDFMELRDWSDQALIDTFGEDLAGQIQDLDRSGRERGRGPGGFGGGGGGGSGDDGGGGGRGGRGGGGGGRGN